ncbi:MAG: hypothetical protein AVDCRST_MAG19-140, partial [uncultured Thermomicrobiales bacterium]
WPERSRSPATSTSAFAGSIRPDAIASRRRASERGASMRRKDH